MILLVTSSYPSFPGDHRGHFVRCFARCIQSGGHRTTVITPVTRALERRDPSVFHQHAAGQTTRADEPRLIRVGRRGDREPWAPVGAGDGVLRRDAATYPAWAEEPRLIQVGRRGDREPWAYLYGGDGILDNLRRHPASALFLVPSMVRLGRVLCREATLARLVVAHWLLPSGLIAAWTRRQHRRPVWIVCHSGGVHSLGMLPPAARRPIAGVLLDGCDLLSFVTPALRDRFLELVGSDAPRFEPRCRILPMGLDVASFSSVVPCPRGPVAVISRLTPIKGIDRLFETAARLDPAPEFRVAGDGPERSRLERLAHSLGLTVDFRGQVPPDRIPGVLNGTRLAALPSRRLASGRTEGLPVAALEALCAGLPLLTTDCWDMPRALADLPGVFRVPSSRQALAHGLEEALAYSSRARPADAATRQLALRTFDWSAIGTIILDWIAELEG